VELLFVRKLRRKERDELYYLLENKKFKSKVLIVLLSYEGCEVREIARRLDVHPETVRRWIRKFNKEGMKCFYKKPGRRREVNSKLEKKILSIALKKPYKLNLGFSTWSLRKLEYYINKKLGIRTSHTQIRKILVKHGLMMRRKRG
jgi:transposase